VAAQFYLGAPKAHWLEKADIPLFLSRNTLKERV
jgi:hypothetical protein